MKEEVIRYSETNHENYDLIKTTAITKLIMNKNEYKARGVAVCKEELAQDWCTTIDSHIGTDDSTWFVGASLEATIQCMEALSSGKSVVEAYTLIDTQNENSPCEFAGMKISAWQNALITRLIENYHPRGFEFSKYREEYITTYASPIER
ncbi:MAG: hypothetical protein R3Y13_02680 [bacterium]